MARSALYQAGTYPFNDEPQIANNKMQGSTVIVKEMRVIYLCKQKQIRFKIYQIGPKYMYVL